VDTRLVRRHSDDAEKRAQSNLTPDLIAAHAGIRVELPVDDDRLAVVDPETLVQRRVPAARIGDAPGSDPDLVDPHLERLAGARAAHFDGADERMAGVLLVPLRCAQLEALTGRPTPAGVQAREPDGVARLDSEDRLEVAREVTVERPPLERDLVVRHR
jgi:hypothetical protein